MANYKLTRTGDGALDLSQVPDAAGRPCVLQHKGDYCVVNEQNAKHALVQRYNGHGLLVEEISLKVGGAPAVPATAPEPPTPIIETLESAPAPLAETPPIPVPAEAPVEPPAEPVSTEPDDVKLADDKFGKKSKGPSGKSR